MSENHNVTQRNLAELSEMIRLENDQDKRSILLVCQGMMAELAQLTHILDGMRREHTSRINDHETKLGTHDTLAERAQTLLKICVLLVTLSSGSLIAAGTYTYKLVADLRDLVTQHEVRLDNLPMERK
jgi:hypothetical protein